MNKLENSESKEVKESNEINNLNNLDANKDNTDNSPSLVPEVEFFVMTFNKLHEGIDCDCVSNGNVSEDIENYFVRRIKGDTPTMTDFLSYYEEGKRIKVQQVDNQFICQYRGISMNKVDSNEEILKNKWIETLKFKPKASKTYCKFKLRSGAGKVQFTPNSDNDSHHTLYKSDQFAIDKLNVIEISSLV